MYEAANLFRDRCLVEGGSFLWPEHHVWTPETITALLDAFTGENAIEGQGTFFEGSGPHHVVFRQSLL